MKCNIILFLGWLSFISCSTLLISQSSFANQNVLLHSSSQRVYTDFQAQLVKSAQERLQARVRYDPSYYAIPYPMGDIPKNKGVCTDVIIRTYRKLNIDLQELVHRDMSQHFLSYPKIWGLTQPDTNIDHRRVPNLVTFFARHNATLPISDNPKIYQPGHMVVWDLGRGRTHIGIVSNQSASNAQRYQIIHNIGSGPVLEDVLFKWKIIGHYYFQPKHIKSMQ